MAFSHVTDHETQALERLATQYADKDGVRALVSAGAGAVQTVEDVVWQLYTERLLDAAAGAQLDNLGAIVGQDRESSTDDQYRARIRARILANRSDNSVEALLGIARAVANDPDAVARLTAYPPASFILDLAGTAVGDDTGEALAAMVKAARAAGVGAAVTWSNAIPGDTFTCDPRASFVTVAALVGDDVLTLRSADLADFPPSGSVTVGVGTAAEETIGYLGVDGADLLLDGTLANAHATGEAVTLDGTDADGFGDDADASIGGEFATVADA